MNQLSWRPPVLRLGWARGQLELRQFFRSRESVVFTIAFPVLMLGLFGAVVHYDVAENVSFAEYFTPMMLAAGLFAASFQSVAIQIPMEREKGTLSRLAMTPLPALSYVIGKLILAGVTAAVSVVIFLAVATLGYGVELPPSLASWAVAIMVGVLGLTACALCGIAISVLPRSARAAPAVITPIALGLQVVSGIFVPVSELPGWLSALGAVFPLRWLGEGFQATLLPADADVPHASLVTIVAILGGWLVLGGWGAQRALRVTDRWNPRG